MGSVEYGVQIIVHTIIICWLIIPAEILVGHLVEDLMIIEIMSCITGDIIAVTVVKNIRSGILNLVI